MELSVKISVPKNFIRSGPGFPFMFNATKLLFLLLQLQQQSLSVDFINNLGVVFYYKFVNRSFLVLAVFACIFSKM